MRGDVSCEYSYGAPPVVNDAEFTQWFKPIAIEVAGAENVKVIPNPAWVVKTLHISSKECRGLISF